MWSAALLQLLGLAWLGGEPVRVVSSSLSSLSSKMFSVDPSTFFRELDLGVLLQLFLTLRDEWARMELGLIDPSTFPRGDSGFMLDRSIDELMNCIFMNDKTKQTGIISRGKKSLPGCHRESRKKRMDRTV